MSSVPSTADILEAMTEVAGIVDDESFEVPTDTVVSRTVVVNKQEFNWDSVRGLDYSACMAIGNYIAQFAHRYLGMAKSLGLGVDDLIQEGFIGACYACRKYHPDKNEFITFSTLYIKGAMLNAVSRAHPVHIAKDEVLKLFREGTLPQAFSTNHEIGDSSSGNKSEWGDTFLVAEEEEDVTLNESDRKFLLKKMGNVLDSREHEILKRVYGLGCEPQAFHAIGTHFGVSKERIRQIHTRAVEKLRNHCRVRIASLV